MKTLTLENFDNIITSINTVLKCDSSWNMQTALVALIEQLEKFDNVFVCFEDETFVCGGEYEFTVEGVEFDTTVTVSQAYEDIKTLNATY